MRFHRQTYLDLLTFGQAPRDMFVELFGPLVGLEDEWRAQGASPEEIDLTAFDWDWVPTVPCGADTGLRGAPADVVLEETQEHRTWRDGLGRTMKLIKDVATVALPLDYPVKTMDDWLKVKPHYVWAPSRVDAAQAAAARKARDEGSLVVAGIPGGFDLPRDLMGDEGACVAYYEQPELMRDILATARDTALRVLGEVSRIVTIDQLSVHEDLAGKSGPLVGPAQVRDFIRPYFRPVWDMLADRGTRVFQLDSDGNVEPVIDALLDCGVTTIYPMEPAAGMDVVAVRRRWGRRLSMLGGIDKHVLRRGKIEIRNELEHKMQGSMRKGGMVFGLDHRIPNGTPLESYRYYVRLGREILGIEPLDGRRRGWRRMAL